MHKQVKTPSPKQKWACDGAHDLVYSQTLVTLTWSTRTPTSSWCTYEQKGVGDGGFSKGLNSPARSGDAHKVMSAAAHDASRAPRGDAMVPDLIRREIQRDLPARYTLEKRGETHP